MAEKILRVNLDNARLDVQREVMQGIIDDNVCPFCVDSLRKYHKRPIIETGEHWMLTENQWPYVNTRFHYLMIAIQHIESILDVGPGAFEELGEMSKLVLRMENTDYGGLAMRFGDITKTGATVGHLHAHIMQASPDMPQGDKLRFKLSG